MMDTQLYMLGMAEKLDSILCLSEENFTGIQSLEI